MGFWESVTGERIRLRDTDIYFGIYKKERIKNVSLLNIVIILLKHLIDVCKLDDVDPSNNRFMAKIKDYNIVEKEMAERSLKWTYYLNTWEIFNTWLPK
jgi:hypothetical protein